MLNFVYVPEKWHDFEWKFFRRIMLNLFTLNPIWYILNTLRYNERRHLPMVQFDLDDEDTTAKIYAHEIASVDAKTAELIDDFISGNDQTII